MPDNPLAAIAQAISEMDNVLKMINARVNAANDALVSLGISPAFLEERYQHHLLERQVRDEGIIGPSAAAKKWKDGDDPGNHPPSRT